VSKQDKINLLTKFNQLHAYLDNLTSIQENGVDKKYRYSIYVKFIFYQGYKAFEGSDRKWEILAEMIKTRTPAQVRSHTQKYFEKM